MIAPGPCLRFAIRATYFEGLELRIARQLFYQFLKIRPPFQNCPGLNAQGIQIAPAILLSRLELGHGLRCVHLAALALLLFCQGFIGSTQGNAACQPRRQLQVFALSRPQVFQLRPNIQCHLADFFMFTQLNQYHVILEVDPQFQ